MIRRICIVLMPVVLSAQTIVKTIPAPGGNNGYYAYGLTWDGEHLWVGDDLDGMIYEVDTADGTVLSSFMGIYGYNQGLAWDGSGFWVTGGHFGGDYIIKFDSQGNILDSIPDLWDGWIGGLGWDGQYLWVSRYYPNTQPNLYRVDVTTGQIVDSIPSPGTQPQGIAWDGQYLWVAMDDNDGDPEKVWKLDPQTGDTLFSFDVPTTRPRGLAWDGQYLWLIARAPEGYAGAIYKIDVGGAGTPEIVVPFTSWNFGDVALGDTAFALFIYSNSGTAALSVDSFTVSLADFFAIADFPVLTPPGENDTILIGFSPASLGPRTGTLTLYTNDPLHPEVEITLEGTGYEANQDISLPETQHDWGNIRRGSEKRWWMRVLNTGLSTLVIDSITLTSPAFRVEMSFPVSIPNTGEIRVPVWFQPPDTGNYQDTLRIYSNDPDEPMVPVTLLGRGIDTTLSGGDIIWSYHAQGSIWRHIRAIRSIPDVNGDGYDDVVAVSENDTLYLFNGNGWGTGDPLWTFAEGTAYLERGLIVTPDLNGDSIHDVVLGTVWGSRKVLAVSGADGSLIWMFDTHNYGNGGWVYEVSTAPDLDGDGIVEILAAAGDDGNHTGPRRVFMLSGASGELIWDALLNYAVFCVRAIGDVNGDGYPEVAAGTADGMPSAYWLYLLDGTTGTPLWSVNTPEGAVWAVIPVGDVNGDGAPDFVAAIGTLNAQLKLFSGSDGTVLWTYYIGGIISELNLLEDVNGNGFPEILPAGAGFSNFLAIDAANGSLVWSTPSGDAVFSMVPIPDVNGDRHEDVIGGVGYTNNKVVLLDGVTGDEIWSIQRPSAVEAVYPISDLDGNGRPDILAGTREGWVLVLADGGPQVDVTETPKTFPYNLSVFPNPVSSHASVRLSVPERVPVSLTLYNSAGRRVRVLYRGVLSSGTHDFQFSGQSLPQGIYFLEARWGKQRKTYPIVVIQKGLSDR